MRIMEELYMRNVIIYFQSNYQSLIHLMDILFGNVKYSISIIEWVILNYSDKNNICINGDYYIYKEYKAALKKYSKKFFDPFSRGKKISFEYAKDKHIITSVCQLNFFYWVFENKIITYIEDNIDALLIANGI